MSHAISDVGDHSIEISVNRHLAGPENRPVPARPNGYSKAVALLLADLGVTKTHSRPHVSNDNPFSESQFKTLKHRPEFPQRFGSLQDARAFCRSFFDWYNTEHRHDGIAFMTPENVHYGRTTQILETRSVALDAAFSAHPHRFKGKRPVPKSLPEAVWINPPTDKNTDKEEVS